MRKLKILMVVSVMAIPTGTMTASPAHACSGNRVCDTVNRVCDLVVGPCLP